MSDFISSMVVRHLLVRRPVACLFFASVFFQAIAGCVSASRSRALTTAATRMEALPFLSVVQVAERSAATWRSDAILTRASFDFAPASKNIPLLASLAYVAGNKGEAWLLVHVAVTEDGQLSARQVGSGIHEVPRDQAEPIEYRQLQVSIYDAIASSIESTQTEGLQQVGQPDWPATAELAHRDRSGYKGSPVWVVTFQNRATSTVLHITLDAMTGEVLDTTLY
jgi:hypothetical protein